MYCTFDNTKLLLRIAEAEQAEGERAEVEQSGEALRKQAPKIEFRKVYVKCQSVVIID